MQPFLPDAQVERIHETVAREYPTLRDAVFVTAADDTRTAFNLMILTPHPKHPTMDLMTNVKGRVADWENDERLRVHFVGAPDKALAMFRAAAKSHAEKVASAKDLI